MILALQEDQAQYQERNTMPQLVGLSNSNFNADRYRREFCDNHGSSLTTERILQGIAYIGESIDRDSNNWIDALKKTPFYISENEAN